MSNTFKTNNAVPEDVRNAKPTFWLNPGRTELALPGTAWGLNEIGREDIFTAAKRFVRFGNVLKTLFPELGPANGIIESPLIRVKELQKHLGLSSSAGTLFVKADHSLPIAGSIKARGGVHEVLEFAERVALANGLVTKECPDNLVSAEGRQLLSKYSVAVGSTGNLGLSIGVIASALGFATTVHMSADAKEWKKKRLRDRGVNVVEHAGDYAAAVAAGRAEAAKDPYCHFVDDESSFSLFSGYSVAALIIKQQLVEKGIVVDREHPLFVYLPCGVGGAPGGIAFGLSHFFGEHVHCFFAEPTASPCFMVAMMDESGEGHSVYDMGLDNRTEADGLAVPKASECAVETMRSALSGIFTVEDEILFRHVHAAWGLEDLKVEPSATAAFDGPGWLVKSEAGEDYLGAHGLLPHLPNATHIVWTTGGLFVPDEEYKKFLDRGAKVS